MIKFHYININVHRNEAKERQCDNDSNAPLDVAVKEVEDGVEGEDVRVAHVEAVACARDDGGVEGRCVGEHGPRGLDEVGELVVDGGGGVAVSAAEGDIAFYVSVRHHFSQDFGIALTTGDDH